MRDVGAFGRRAESYERGWLGEWHLLVTHRVADVALSAVPAPGRVLDVGCGTGALLRRLAVRLPGDSELVGVDPAPRMLAEARKRLGGVRLEQAAAERVPFADTSFDLVVSAMSFDHWADQALGLAECARVLRPGAVSCSPTSSRHGCYRRGEPLAGCLLSCGAPAYVSRLGGVSTTSARSRSSRPLWRRADRTVGRTCYVCIPW